MEATANVTNFIKPGSIVINTVKPGLIAPYILQELAGSSTTIRLLTNVRPPLVSMVKHYNTPCHQKKKCIFRFSSVAWPD